MISKTYSSKEKHLNLFELTQIYLECHALEFNFNRNLLYLFSSPIHTHTNTNTRVLTSSPWNNCIFITNTHTHTSTTQSLILSECVFIVCLCVFVCPCPRARVKSINQKNLIVSWKLCLRLKHILFARVFPISYYQTSSSPAPYSTQFCCIVFFLCIQIVNHKLVFHFHFIFIAYFYTISRFYLNFSWVSWICFIFSWYFLEGFQESWGFSSGIPCCYHFFLFMDCETSFPEHFVLSFTANFNSI